MSASGSILRVAVLALVVLAFWIVGRTFQGMPEPKGPGAAPTEFSSARANATLGRLLGPEIPHPVSTPANHAVQGRVRAEFAVLGIKTTIYRATGCNGRPKYGFFVCGTVEDVLAEVVPGEGKAIVLLAHYDSVPAGPGASDDQSGVATILETVRALKARGLKSKHPILAVVTDGEEAGLLGAAAFVDNPAFRARVGVAVNAEARGNQGPSLLFQTSPADSALIDLYDRSVPGLDTSSLFAVIFKLLPNDTDLTVFLNKGLSGYNFAFTGNVAHYHTLLDTRAHLDPATLQMHGDNVLGVVSSLMQTDFAALNGRDAIYLTLLGQFIPRVPASWALPLALAALALLIAAAFLSRGEVLGIGRRLAAIAMPLAIVIGAAAFGWVLFTLAALISGQPDPSYAYPVWLRIAFALGVLSAVIFASRLASARMAALSVWGWFVGLGLVTAALLPGLCPYFLFPALVATPLLLAQSRLSGAWSGPAGEAAIFAAALLPLLIWLTLASSGETVQGLALHPLFTVPAAFGAMTLVPLLSSRPLPRRTALRLGGGVAGLALIFAVVAGLMPAFSAEQPQRLNIDFVDDHIANKAEWAIETGAKLPAAFRRGPGFSQDAQPISPILRLPAFVMPAGATRFTVPAATASYRTMGAGRVVTLKLQSAPGANRLVVVVPKDAGLTQAALGGRNFETDPNSLNPVGTILACVTDDCSGTSFTLTFASRKPVTLMIGEQRYGLPPDGKALTDWRPDNTVASQNGDTTIVFGKLKLP